MKEAVRAIILDSEEKILLARRAEGSIAAGEWHLVGGKPETGELIYEAIRREVHEELGANIENVEFFRSSINLQDNPVDPWVTYFYSGTISGRVTLLNNEVAEIRYFSLDELDGLNIAFKHEKDIRAFFEAKK